MPGFWFFVRIIQNKLEDTLLGQDVAWQRRVQSRKASAQQAERETHEARGTAAFAEHHFGEPDENSVTRCVRCGKTTGDARRRYEGCIKVEIDLNHNDEFSAHVERLRASYPELPPIPQGTVHYEGWFQDVYKRIQLRSQHRTLAEQQKLLTLVRLLHEEFKRICSLRFDINRMKGEDLVKQLETQKEIITLRGEILTAERELETARTPSKTAELRDQVEQMKLRAEMEEHNLRRAKAEADISKIKNPAPSQSPRPKEDDLSKLMRQWISQQARKAEKRSQKELNEEFMAKTRAWGEDMGYDPEQVVRDATKVFDEHYPGWRYKKSAG